MTGQRIRLILALAAFFAWISWLAFTVYKNGNVPVISRAQLTASTCLIVADLDDSILQKNQVTVLAIISGTGPAMGESIPVVNLQKVIAAGLYATPTAGPHLIPLAKTPDGVYKIAGLPSSPGYNLTDPERPLVYPWNDDVKKQLRRLGFEVK